MRKTTPSRYAAESRPPFTTSTSAQNQNRSVAPNMRNRAASPQPSYPRPRGVAFQQPMVRTPHGGATFLDPQQQHQARFAAPGGFSSPAVVAGPPLLRKQNLPFPRSPPQVDENISAMLNDLVHISHNIERYIQENPNAVGSAAASSAAVGAQLKAEEIERVVRRVESHFQAKLQQQEATLQEQKDVIIQLSKERDMWRRKAEQHQASSSPAAGTPVNTASREPVPVDSLLDGVNLTLAVGPKQGKERDEIQQLKHVLAEEKRQRLLVEEQTQSLTEQHAKVVHTLEQRIRKQDKQLQEIIEVFEHQQQQSLGNQQLQSSATPHNGNNISGAPEGENLRGTPRSLKFRQRQLRLGEETMNQESTPRSSGAQPPAQAMTTSDARAAQEASTIALLRRAQSTDITDVIEVTQQASSRTDSPPLPASRGGGGHIHEQVDIGPVDDVALFLANISKELECINDLEVQRHSKITSFA